ncbi:hypothetical protein B5X24_HaOG216738 [Helicoverpa armigera]|nr:hypothetical protein B5X24_HaOG216738 [Helicoverpa armigera]
MPIAYEALKSIQFLQKQLVNIKIQWITSHIGVPGNEMADKLASEAIADGIVIPGDPYFTELIPHMKKFCHNLWEEHFSFVTARKGLWYRTIQHDLPRAPWFDVGNMPRELLVLAFRIRSGHVPANRFLHLMGVKPSPLCNTCTHQVVDDLYHILLECCAFDDLRLQLCTAVGGDMYSGGVNVLLGRPLSEQSVSIYKFVKDVFLRRDSF